MEQGRSRSETVLAASHLTNMGRDEMNLAEFPLATLADRAPRGCKTLVFKDRIWDRGQRQHRIRQLTISASDKYGLPTATDDEVVLGLVQLTKAAGFAERRVRFSRYQLIQLLGWRDEGRSYRRLDESLKRWLGVTLYYENAWWDRAQKMWVDANLHLLEEWMPCRRHKRLAADSESVGDRSMSSFTWNETVFRSFQAGFLKRLDMALYRCLNLAAAKRMYRFLDKRFHYSGTLRFRLPTFACEHVGLSRRYDAAQLKRRLNPAVAELERAGYLTPLPASERYHRLRRGEWEVVFVHNPELRRQRRRVNGTSDLENRLVERGVTASAAVQLVRKHAAGLIDSKIAVFDALRQKDDRRISRNPAGFLVQSIRDDYVPPAGFGGRPSRVSVSRRAADARENHRATPKTACSNAKVFHVETSHAMQYLSGLSPSAREELEAKAMKHARRVPADGFHRATAAGKAEVADQYRQVILEQYVREIIGIDSESAGNRVTAEPV